ncbi:hypothetical protein EYF80_040389 [Liparis tanakae]|uniref:Uncharacterized protein n=1 Tax=Liparis tanakae TaxID=230148 RepID=A0A4Z2G9C9_9TELE|nr:hypothetical protein EYF80_040389 [Liparis tanakae]
MRSLLLEAPPSEPRPGGPALRAGSWRPRPQSRVLEAPPSEPGPGGPALRGASWRPRPVLGGHRALALRSPHGRLSGRHTCTCHLHLERPPVGGLLRGWRRALHFESTFIDSLHVSPAHVEQLLKRKHNKHMNTQVGGACWCVHTYTV